MSPLLKKTSFDSSKCVSLLELTLKRIKILKSKRLIVAKQSRDDVAKLLEKGQYANAVARVEYAFREQNIAEAYDLLEQYCHLVIKRISAIKAQQECPSEVKEAVDSLIYAAPRCGDLQELQKLRDLVTIKYGAEYCAVVLELGPGCLVNQQIIQKLSSRPPSFDTRLKLLKEIAVENRINWNQRAVEASLKNEEASMQEEQKCFGSQQVSKRAVSTDVDNAILHSPDQKEAVKLAANHSVPSKSKNENLPKANQVFDVAQQPTIADVPKPSFDSLEREHEHRDRHKSHAAQNTSPSTTHSNSPEQREFASASSRKSTVASPVNVVDKEKPHGFPVQQVNLKGEESLAAKGDASRSAMDTSTSRQKDVMDASDKSLQKVAYKQNLHSMHAPHVELKSQQSTHKPSQIFDPHHEGEKFASPKHMGSADRVKPASVVKHQDGLLEKNSPKLSSTADITKPEAFVNPMQVPNVSIRKSFERKFELDEAKGQATSSQNFYEARASSSKPSLRSGINHEIDDDTSESLAAKQYLRAHRSYVKTEAGGGEDDYRNTEDSGSKLRTNYGSDTPRADPYVRLRHEGKMDYKNMPTYEQVKATRRTPGATYPETQDTSLYDSNSHQVDPYVSPRQDGRMDYKNNSPSYEQIKESRRNFGAVEEEEKDARRRSRQDREMDYKNISPAYDQIKESRRTPRAMNQGEDASLRSRQDRRKDYKNSSPAYEQVKESRRTPRAMADSEFERDFADVQAKMESADRAAEAAKAAIDMARMSSMRSKTNSEVGNVKDFLRESYSRTSFKSSSGDVHTSIEDVVQGLGAVKDEHESRLHKHLPRHAEMRRANTEVQAVPHQEQEPDFCDLRTPHFDNYGTDEFGEEELLFYAKSRAYTGKKDGGMAINYQGRSAASYGYAYDAPIRPAGEGSMRDVSKQRWKLTANEEFDAEQPSQVYTRASQNDQYPAIVHQEAQVLPEKAYGVSRRSGRSSKLI